MDKSTSIPVKLSIIYNVSLSINETYSQSAAKITNWKSKSDDMLLEPISGRKIKIFKNLSTLIFSR